MNRADIQADLHKQLIAIIGFDTISGNASLGVWGTSKLQQLLTYINVAYAHRCRDGIPVGLETLELEDITTLHKLVEYVYTCIADTEDDKREEAYAVSMGIKKTAHPNYKILSSPAISGLEAKVQAALDAGWVLQGGVSVVERRTTTAYYQALHRVTKA